MLSVDPPVNDPNTSNAPTTRRNATANVWKTAAGRTPT